jgi:hypothetical protein
MRRWRKHMGIACVWLLAVGAIAMPSTTASQQVAQPAPAASISVRSHLARPSETPIVGRELRYIISVVWQGGLDVGAPEAPRFEGLEWRNSQTSDTIAGERIHRDYIFRLVPTREGRASIGSTRIHYTDRATGAGSALSIGAMELTVAPAPRQYGRAIGTVGVAVLVLGGLTLAVAAGVRRAQAKARRTQPPPLPSPFEELRSGDEALRRLVIEGDSRGFFGLLAKRVRAYLALARGATGGGDSRGGGTTQEMVARLRTEEPPRPERERLIRLLEQCEAVQYAGHSPTREECEAAMGDWKGLLETSAPPGGSGE